MSDDYLIRRTKLLTEGKIDDELVALDVEQGSCYGFNATATRVWGLIEQPSRFSSIQCRLQAEFRVEPETCNRELMTVLRWLEKEGIVALDIIDD